MNATAAQDRLWMARALRLAEHGRYTTDPNPRVGCVLVRDERVVGEGWHRLAGGPHAEVVALEAAGGAARGATAYVTLEPCCHHGRTPPCTGALIAAGVARVVAAVEDPNPRVAGQGLAVLREAGVSTACGVLAKAARRLNRGFFQRMGEGRPFVFGKLAMSLDGRTALAGGESRWITSDASRRDVHRLRAQSSAILTGIDTVLADDPRLTARLDTDEAVVQPLRVVLDSSLRTPPHARMAGEPGCSLIVTISDDTDRTRRLRDAGFEVERVAASGDGRVDLQSMLQLLARRGVNELMVEAGPRLNGALLQAGLVDEWVIYLAPCILGDTARGLFQLPPLADMAGRYCLGIAETRRIGPDLRLLLRPLSAAG